ncbi:MAG: putative bifunctional diguanylate cyclase/phosphodiesterase [Actinomycetota bacterium]
MKEVTADAGHHLAELVPDLLCVCIDGDIASINQAGIRLLGASSYGEVAGRPFTAFVHAEDHPMLADGLAALAERPGPHRLRLVRLDGSSLHARVLFAGIDGPRTVAIHACEGRAHDALAAQVFDTTSDGIMVLDAELKVTAVNPAACEITGWAAAELVGAPAPCLADGVAEAEPLLQMWEEVRLHRRWQGEMWTKRRDGQSIAARLGVSTVVDDAGRPSRYVVAFSDITQRKLDEERIRRQATYDQLTGLPNRSLFLDRLGQSVHQASRYQQMVGLMFIDLDGFKLVNDTLGHDLGDLLLQEAGRRLSACIRAGDTVARLGGDEFTVLMPNLGNYQNAPRVAQRILDALRRPFDLAGKEAFVSASIGITIYPDDAPDASAMLKNADAAMYRAKEQGKAHYQFYTSDMNAAVEERLHIKTGLANALERDELMLTFQPKADLKTGRVTGVEALLRWTAPSLGQVSPAKFIPVMEETGLIRQVGEWVMAAACRQHRAWVEQGLGHLRVAVNLSTRQLRQPGFVDLVRRLVDEAGITPSGLEFEITEGMIMKDTENAVAILEQLSAMGISLAMDDFGTGYSSLSYLRRFPVHTIKIDRTFIADLATDQDAHEIVRTIITMGHSMHRRIVAEGVETLEQAHMLAKMHCDEVQGYLLSPPVPATAIPALAEHELRL